MTAHTRRQILQTTSALALATALPRCASLGREPLQPVAFADIPRSDYGFATTADDVVAGMDLSGKMVLITGCNSGLGYESMRALAGAGAHVIGTARTTEKASQACQSVAGTTTPTVLELTDMNSIVSCASEVNALLKGMNKPLDILILNAGIMALPKLEQVGVNGVFLEKQFVVNHLGHYLLTRKLLPKVASSPAGRIVSVSSMGYSLAPAGGIQFDNLSGDAGYKPFQAYGQTKLANILLAKELDRRYFSKGVVSNAIHPGLVDTNLGRYMRGGTAAPAEKKERPLRKGMKTAAQGASTQVYVATDPRLAGVSGFYFGDCNPEELKGDYATDPALARRLWDVSADLVKPWLS